MIAAGKASDKVKKSGAGKAINGIPKPKIAGKVNNRQGMTKDSSIKHFLSKAKAKVPAEKHGPKGARGAPEMGKLAGPHKVEVKVHKGGIRKADFMKDKHDLHGASKKPRLASKRGSHSLMHNKMFEGGKGKGSEK